jgi:ribosome-associated protein
MSYRYSKTKIDKFIHTIWHKECSFDMARSSGPWGQNVNKRETKVQLSRPCKISTTLPHQYHTRFIEMYISFLTDEWVLRLDSQVHRTQDMNKEVVRKKLAQMIHNAFKPLKWPRKMTTPPQHAIDARIAEKKRRSKTRSSRTVVKWFL